MTATTALTVQNTQGVFDIHHTPPSFVARQINTCIDDMGVDVVKIGKLTVTQFKGEARALTNIGMLASTETVRAVAETLRNRSEQFEIVLDPVRPSISSEDLV